MKQSAINRLTWTLIVLFASVSLVAAQAESDDKANDSSPRGKIIGRVVDQSGQPVANAGVNIRGYGNAQDQNVKTDNEGKFEAGDLPPMAYLISARSPAYVSKPRDPDVNPFGYYHVGDVVRLELVKGGVITGAVRRANGEPVVRVNINVHLVRDYKGQPVRYSTQGQTYSTDDRGVYRIYGLAPGTYVVSAGGAETETFRVNPFATDAPTYAPSSTRDTAAEITVTAGEEISNIDIGYRDESGHFVSGGVTSVAVGQGYQLTLNSIVNGIEQASYESYQSPFSRVFVFAGVADGDYTMIARAWSASGVWSISDPRAMKVRGADITGVELNVKPMASISGAVVLEDSKAVECQGKRRPVLAEIVIAAWHNEKNEPKDQTQLLWGLGGPRTPDQKGSFTLHSLAAGQYRFVTRPLAKYWYLKSISWPAAAKAIQTNQPIDAARNWTTIKSGDNYSGLMITFAAGAASLAGRIESPANQKAASRVFVYLAPAEVEKREDVLRYFVSLAAEDGSFSLSNVPPGRYWIVAKAANESDTNLLSKLRMPDETELRARILKAAETEKATTELKPCQNLTDYHLTLQLR